MLTNQKIKWIKSLEAKKERKEAGCFVIEGEKMVRELLHSDFVIREMYALDTLYNELRLTAKSNLPIFLITEQQLERISQLKTPNQVLAIAELPNNPTKINLGQELYLALENIQDPGNLGTIIRTAAWLGIGTIFCSPETVDVFNPKVVQATMGALFSVKLIYQPLEKLIDECHKKSIATFGTRLDGENLYKIVLPKNAVIFMGNESKGLSEKISRQVSKNLYIPTYPAGAEGVESLNVSVAAAIICAEFRRQSIQ